MLAQSLLLALAAALVQGAALKEPVCQNIVDPTRVVCPLNPPLSCTYTSADQVDTCCSEFPGGVVLQTQFWDAQPSFGPLNKWTVHGLWPDNCDGTYKQYCNEEQEVSNVTALLTEFGKTNLLRFMKTYWKDNTGDDESFWEHEYNKHGTCMSTIQQECYDQQNYKPHQNAVDFFEKVVEMYSTLPTFDWLAEAGIIPSDCKTYKRADIEQALAAKHGGVPYLGCVNGTLDEVWYMYHLKGTILDGEYISIESLTPSTCPDDVQYLPKN